MDIRINVVPPPEDDEREDERDVVQHSDTDFPTYSVALEPLDVPPLLAAMGPLGVLFLKDGIGAGVAGPSEPTDKPRLRLGKLESITLHINTEA